MTQTLVFILGDQLDLSLEPLQQCDPKSTTVLMAEVKEESTKIPSHKVRTVMFLSAMRHFKEELIKQGFQVSYQGLDDKKNTQKLSEELLRAIKQCKPQRVLMTEAGEWKIQKDLLETLKKSKVSYEIFPDTRFLCSKEEFKEHAKGRKQLRMEFFYRSMRQRYKILMDGKTPVGGEWNFDASNRGSFGKKGPSKIPQLTSKKPDTITKEVIKLVETQFPENPGSLNDFDWPVTTKEAQRLLDTFISKSLSNFGKYQDAMWTEQPYLYHSRISAALNLGLLNPMTAIQKVEKAYHDGLAPLEAVEGFIRQILGWREYIRGMYWLFMPDYLKMNYLGAKEPLPALYWTGDTKMNCMRSVVGQTLQYGYTHHIQRLMVTGLFSLMLGIQPKEIHEWYLAVYLDAIEWVELPNTLGMSQFVDGGKLASKPYVATGKYIKRMSNYCQDCIFDPEQSTGTNACPFTTFYWDFLLRHEKKLQANPRMSLQLRNLKRLSQDKISDIQSKAKEYRKQLKSQKL